jgi:WD40 repeat protein
VGYSPDGQRLASATGLGEVKLWDIKTGQETATLKGKYAVFSPDGNRLAGIAEDDTVKIFDATPLPEKP